MNKVTILSLVLIIIVTSAGIPASTPASAAVTIPTFSIVNVVRDQTVTIRTSNFPANDTFDVLMGKIGTRGVGGIKVTTQQSGSGGTFEATYTIPAALHGLSQIAIRLQSPTSGYFAFNWFWNTTGVVMPPLATATPGPSPTPGPISTGFPTFSIIGVVRDQTVTIRTNNLPPNDRFDVLMAPSGNRAIGGLKVTTTDSGTGGVKEFTYNIPASLHGTRQIAIRLQSPTSGYFAFNWFWNTTTVAVTPGTPAPTTTPVPGVTFPTFSILSVARDQTVTIRTQNLPPNDTFNVRMGAMGTRGIGGTLVSVTPSGTGGTQTFTYTIPSQFHGAQRIAIRMESPTSGFFAFNWFWNNTTIAITPVVPGTPLP